MKKQLFGLVCLSALFFTNCQKDLASKSTNETDKSTAGSLSSLQSQFTGTDSVASWYGSYAGYYGPYPPVAESEMIHDGVAEDPFLDQPFSFSNVSLDIPAAYSIPGDSIIFEAVAKNPQRLGASDYDIVLQVVGEQNSVELHFVSRTASQQYNQYYVGSKRVYNLPQLVQTFYNFKTVRLAFSNDRTAASVNNKEIYGFNYGAGNRIGKIKSINVAGFGYGIVDNVRLLNSKTKQPILSEDFNGNGQSHTIFY